MFYYYQSYCTPFVLSQSVTDTHNNAYLYYLVILTMEPHSFFLLSFMYKMLGKAVCVCCFSVPTQLCKNGSWVSLQYLFTNSFRDHTACCQLITLYGNIFSCLWLINCNFVFAWSACIIRQLANLTVIICYLWGVDWVLPLKHKRAE